jgi:hypothetical protein
VQGILQPRFTVVGESMTEAAILEKTGQPDAGMPILGLLCES